MPEMAFVEHCISLIRNVYKILRMINFVAVQDSFILKLIWYSVLKKLLLNKARFDNKPSLGSQK